MTPRALGFLAFLAAASLLPAEPSTQPNTNLTPEQLASRFLGQATFGARGEEITKLAGAIRRDPGGAYAAWLEAEFQKPLTDADRSLVIFREAFPPDYPNRGYRQRVWEAGAVRAGLMITSDCQLRQRIAYSLGQIFVVSIQGDLIGHPEGLCDWQDLLVTHAYGNFRDLLLAVTTHPAMGAYLTSAGNAKADYRAPGARPDENYAREVMQLFTIGLYHLQPDGEFAVKDGKLIPTYDNDDISELARVFTGMSYPKGNGEGSKKAPDGGAMVMIRPNANVRYGSMSFIDKAHDKNAKSFPGGAKLPAGRSAREDIEEVIDRLGRHPSTAPFIARSLIQRLVTSNPSPAYVGAVAEAFRQSDGDLKAVISAILLHPEARDPQLALEQTAGKLREPWLRVTHAARAFQARTSDTGPSLPVFQRKLLPALGQFPLASPSVFNFYLPDYEPPGEITLTNENIPKNKRPVVAPEFQILNAFTAIQTPNYLLASLQNRKPSNKNRSPLAFDLSRQTALANDSKALLENVDTLLTAGMMSNATRHIILKAIESLPSDTNMARLERARMAVYLTLVSPDYAVQK